MPIRAVAATEQGKKVAENYCGDTEEVSFLQVIILARTQEVTQYSEVHRFLAVEYPTPLVSTAILGAVSKLEKQGLLRVIREVDFDTHIYVKTGPYSIPTTLGGFVNGCLKNIAVPITEICEELMWYGETRRMPDVKLTLR
jgi:hypothetical protein